MTKTGGRTVSDALTILINSVEAVDDITPSKMPSTVELISNTKVDIHTVQHSRFWGRDLTTATFGSNRNRLSSVGNIQIDVFVGTDKVVNDIIVFLNSNLNLVDAANGPKLYIIFLLEGKMTAIATR